MFCSYLKLRGMANIVGYEVIFQEELGRLELQKRWNSTGQNVNLCICRLIKNFVNKLEICCLHGFIYQSWDGHVLLIC